MRWKYTKRNEVKRIEKLKEKLRQKFPQMEFTPETTNLLRLAGTMSYFPVTKDREKIAETMTRKYL